jgi:hypothetical protein
MLVTVQFRIISLFVSYLKTLRLKYAKVHVIFSLVLYGRGTWSPIMMLEKGVLRRIFGRKRPEVTAVWRRLHNEELAKY